MKRTHLRNEDTYAWEKKTTINRIEFWNSILQQVNKQMLFAPSYSILRQTKIWKEKMGKTASGLDVNMKVVTTEHMLYVLVRKKGTYIETKKVR